MEEQGAIVGRGAKRGPGEKVILTLEMHLIYVRRWFKKDFYQVAQQRFNKSHIARTLYKIHTFLVKFNLILEIIMEFNCQNLTANRRF